MTRPLARHHLFLLLGVLGVAALVRGVNPGADLPYDAEGTGAKFLDAYWYMESAAGPAEGSTPERLLGYDVPVWSSLARTWFEVFGASLASAQALGACVSLACILLTWRILRAGLGDTAALAGAATLAVFYPYATLSRTTLIYGPVTLALLVAAAVWLRSRRQPGVAGVAHVAAALSLVFAAGMVTRPPALTLLGGFALAAVVRWPRLRRPAAALLAFGAAGLLLFLGVPEVREWVLDSMRAQGGFLYQNADRIDRKLDPSLTPVALLRGALTWGVAPTAGQRGLTASGIPLLALGVFSLAPGAVSAATFGGLLSVGDRRRLSPARGETLALFAGWGLTFVAASLFLVRPTRALRYYVLLAPPLAAFVGYAASWAFDPTPTRPAMGPGVAGDFADPPEPEVTLLRRLASLDPLFAAATALLSAMLWPHLATVLIGPLADHDVLGAGLQGAAMGLTVLVVVLALDLRRPPGWVGLVVILGLALLPSTVRLAQTLPNLPTYGRNANAALPKVIDRETAVLVGPYASFLALGNGIERRRAGDFITTEERFHMTLNLLRPAKRPWATHLAVDAQQERSAHVVERFAQEGHPLHHVATLSPYGPHANVVWIFRFPWAEEQGYHLSEHEQRLLTLDVEASDEEAQQARKIFTDK